MFGSKDFLSAIQWLHNLLKYTLNSVTLYLIKEIKVAFLHISKAFDQVWHKGLLEKLSKFEIHGRHLQYFTSCLTDRIQYFIINGQTSEWASVKSGLLQGSVLGPLLVLG